MVEKDDSKENVESKKEGYTRTVPELASFFGLKTTQIPYHVKKHLDDLGEHVYKKPGTTTPYQFDEVGYDMMVEILKKSYSPVENSSFKGDSSSFELQLERLENNYIERAKEYEARISEMKEQYEARINEQQRQFEEIIAGKDELIKEKDSHLADVFTSMQYLNNALDQQQQLSAIDKSHTSDKTASIDSSPKKKGFFSKFRKQKGE